MIYQEKFDGGFIFAIQDEWFKRSWHEISSKFLTYRNTMAFERSGELWHNSLTNEEHFGLIAADPGPNYQSSIHLGIHP